MGTMTELPAIHEPLAGGFYAGTINVGGVIYALIVAPKAEGEHKNIAWNGSTKSVARALSYCDGRANTLAMAEDGSELAKWALALRIGGHDDWYLPSQDELEILYRAFKPTEEQNWCYARSGINLSAVPPTRPYTPEVPVKTVHEAFQAGGAEAFDAAWYWSSTQYASGSDCAWRQGFSYGGQYDGHKGIKLRARAVRRLPI
jgi:hypothetical protein